MAEVTTKVVAARGLNHEQRKKRKQTTQAEKQAAHMATMAAAMAATARHSEPVLTKADEPGRQHARG